jgi:hypothetical protein
MIMKHKYTLLKAMAWTTLVLGFGLMAWIAFMLFFPVKTLEVNNQPMPITNQHEFEAGDVIWYRYDYCKYYDVPLSITKQFVDGIIFTTDSTYGVSNLQVGCHVKEVGVVVPQTLPAGTYRIRIITVIAVNRLRNETVVYETVPFKVVTHTDDKQDKVEE